MRKLLVVAAAVLALALLVCSCGSGDPSSSTQSEARQPAKILPAKFNVGGRWYRWKGPTHEGFMESNARGEVPYSRSRFIVNQKSLHLELNPEATLVVAEACYTGVDLFCDKWNGSSALPLVKSFTASTGKQYRIHLVEAFVGIRDQAGIKPTQSEKAAN